VPAEPSLAGLQPVASIDESMAPASFEAPPTAPIHVPLTDVTVLAICVAVTIAAGVSSFAIDFAHAATLLF
jgi:hypothetical protein